MTNAGARVPDWQGRRVGGRGWLRRAQMGSVWGGSEVKSGLTGVKTRVSLASFCFLLGHPGPSLSARRGRIGPLTRRERVGGPLRPRRAACQGGTAKTPRTPRRERFGSTALPCNIAQDCGGGAPKVCILFGMRRARRGRRRGRQGDKATRRRGDGEREGVRDGEMAGRRDGGTGTSQRRAGARTQSIVLLRG